MSYETKLKAMEVMLEEHNEKMKEIDPTKTSFKVQFVDTQLVKNGLIMMGATSEAALSQCSFEDLESCGIPKLIARTVATIFRNGPTPELKEKPGWVSDRMVERMSYEELIARYNPIEESAVYRKLSSLSQGKAFLVFLEGNAVDVVTSTKLLQELKQGYGERPLLGISVDGAMKPIYRVGEKPDNLVDENPLYPGRALRPDGTCDQLNRSWAGVSLAVRQFAYLLVTKGGGGSMLPLAITDAHTILDTALANKTDEAKIYNLSQRYGDAALKYEQAKKQGTLPTLKIELGKQTNKPAENKRVTIIR